MDSVFLFAGEPSGDLHGSHLLKQLHKRFPSSTKFTGVGGPKMRSEGFQAFLEMEEFAVMGFTDVIKSLPKILRQLRQVCDFILDTEPSAVILIDYPDFNLRLASRLRKKGYAGKIIQYISPTVWAWRRRRVQTMGKHLDLLLTIYPFEENFYKSSSLPVIFVGNPLQEYLSHYTYRKDWKEIVGLSSNQPIVALFPGSRHGEIARNFPLQLEAVKQLVECSIAISYTTVENQGLITRLLHQAHCPLDKITFIPSLFTYELMRDSHLALAKSGTVTLELALHATPTVVMYKLSSLNYFFAKYIARLNLPHYCIVNILLNQTVFPEFINGGVAVEKLHLELQKLNRAGTERQHCIENCQKISRLLGDRHTSSEAAEAIARLFP